MELGGRGHWPHAQGDRERREGNRRFGKSRWTATPRPKGFKIGLFASNTWLELVPYRPRNCWSSPSVRPGSVDRPPGEHQREAGEQWR